MQVTADVQLPTPEDGSYMLDECPIGTLGTLVSDNRFVNGQVVKVSHAGAATLDDKWFWGTDVYGHAIRVLPFPPGTKVTLTVH